VNLGPLRRADRARLAELLVATGAFRSDEVEVALSLFDLSHGDGAVDWRDDPTAYQFLGAFEDGRLMGYACFGATPATEGTYDLYWLAVDPTAQGRGIGRALVRAVEQTLAARAARLLLVETSSRPDYAATREFYARNGFAEAARVRDFYAPADDRIVFTTRLTTNERGAATR
jgi:ribosomal protein S18 acetylase RimI-like enzyme